MPTPATFSDKTSADDKAIGFDYQYYFFLLRLLYLKTGESVGLEVVDDVHTELNNDYQILFQLKHTTQTNAAGQPINLRRLDKDVWKTVSNWSKLISDDAAGRGEVKDQLAFVSKTDFVLVSNKSEPGSDGLKTIFSEPSQAAQSLVKLQKETKDEDIQDYLADVLKLEPQVLPRFVEKVSFDLELNDLIGDCKNAIREKQIHENRVEQLFSALDSRIRQDNFIAVRSGRKIVVTYEQWNAKYRRFFDLARTTQLQVLRKHAGLPESIADQTFIRQLADSGDVVTSDTQRMTELTTLMKVTDNNLLRWEIEGEITADEVGGFDEEAITIWDNTFREKHRESETPETHRALAILYALRKERLAIGEQVFDVRFSNGQFYRLANKPKIGFVENWKTRYRGNE